MSQTVTKTRYSDDELEEFRMLIQQKLDKAKEQLHFNLEQLSEEASDAKLKGLENATGASEKEQLNRIAARQKKHIQHLENALLRIQNKVYGVCRESGKLISKERLQAVPHATLSIAAKTGQRK
ncbi:MAG: DnaK suppressor protein [Paraglaciecola sp.]|jgi:DnaK suppressor protein